MVAEQYSRITRLRVGDQPVINQRQFVAEAFEALPQRHLLIGLKVIKPAGFDGCDQFGEVVVELVEDSIHHRAPVGFGCCGVPEFHTSIVLEYVFDGNWFSQLNKEIGDQNYT